MPDLKVTSLAWDAVHNKPNQMEVKEWGGTDKVNCYAFAVNCKTPGRGKPDPGDRTATTCKIHHRYDADLIRQASVADGLILHKGGFNDPPAYRDNYFVVACFLSEDYGDHHWYRKDPVTGRWVHKPGPQAIRNYDRNFNVLPSELILANHNYGMPRTNYKHFVAFFEVPDGGVDVG